MTLSRINEHKEVVTVMRSDVSEQRAAGNGDPHALGFLANGVRPSVQ
jgi:hypothetical protein